MEERIFFARKPCICNEMYPLFARVSTNEVKFQHSILLIFHMRHIRTNVYQNLSGFVWRRHFCAHPDVGRKPTEMSVTEFCHRNVISSAILQSHQAGVDLLKITEWTLSAHKNNKKRGNRKQKSSQVTASGIKMLFYSHFQLVLQQCHAVLLLRHIIWNN